MEIYVKNIFYFHISFFSGFQTWFYKMRYFTRIAVSNIANDDVTNQVKHRIFNTNLLHSVAHFVVKIYEKFSLNDGFWYDLMMTLDSGLLFGATLYTLRRPI